MQNSNFGVRFLKLLLRLLESATNFHRRRFCTFCGTPVDQAHCEPKNGSSPVVSHNSPQIQPKTPEKESETVTKGSTLPSAPCPIELTGTLSFPPSLIQFYFSSFDTLLDSSKKLTRNSVNLDDDDQIKETLQYVVGFVEAFTCRMLCDLIPFCRYDPYLETQAWNWIEELLGETIGERSIRLTTHLKTGKFFLLRASFSSFSPKKIPEISLTFRFRCYFM